MTIAAVPRATNSQTVVYKIPRFNVKKSVLVLGTYADKHKFVHSLYIALTKLAELGMIKNPGLLDNNVLMPTNEEFAFARISFKNKKKKEVWVIGVPEDVSSHLLSSLDTAIRALRGTLPHEAESSVDAPKYFARVMENVKDIVYVYESRDQLYAALEISNLISAIEGRKVRKLAVVSLGRGGIPNFIYGSLEAIKEMGYLKSYSVHEAPALNNFEMLKLSKFLFL